MYLNRTDGKDNCVRLRTSSGMIGEDGSKPNPNTKPNPKKKETKERNLEKGKNYQTDSTVTTKLQNQLFHIQ